MRRTFRLLSGASFQSATAANNRRGSLKPSELPDFDSEGYSLRPLEQIPKFPNATPLDARPTPNTQLSEDEGKNSISPVSAQKNVGKPAATTSRPMYSDAPDTEIIPDTPEEEGELSDRDPLTASMRNVNHDTYQVTWFNQELRPAKSFLYFAFRKIRHLPPDWQDYYRRLLRQEIYAARYIKTTWDVFMMIVEGYRKVKWILKKYDIPFKESDIPSPYGNFWEQTTHEERLWAHRRSFQLKEMQAVQREEDDLVFGAMCKDMTEVVGGKIHQACGTMQYGTPVHSHDMPAPYEQDVVTSRANEEMSSALLSSVEDDKIWNPVLKQRLIKQHDKAEAEFYSFEDEDD